MTISWARAVSRINSRQRSPTSPPRTATRYLVVQTPSYLQSQTVWLPRLYPSILPVYAAKCRRPKPPKGVGFTDPLSGTLNRFHLRNEAYSDHGTQIGNTPPGRVCVAGLGGQHVRCNMVDLAGRLRMTTP